MQQEDSLDSAAPENQAQQQQLKNAPALYSGGNLEWEAFEEAVAARITEERFERGSVRSDPTPVTKREEGWNFPSWFPSYGVADKHVPLEGDAAAHDDDDTSVLSGSVFDNVSVMSLESRIKMCSPVASFAEMAEAASLGLAASEEEEEEEEDSVAKSQRSSPSRKSQRSSASRKSYRSTGSRSQRSSASKASFEGNKDLPSTAAKSPSRPTSPARSVRSAASNHSDKAQDLQGEALDMEEEKKEDDVVDPKLAALLKTHIKNESSWSSVSVNSRKDAGSVLKSLTYSFSHGSSASSSSKTASVVPVPPAVSRSKAVEKAAANTGISEPPVLTSDRQLALLPKISPFHDTTSTTTTTVVAPTVTITTTTTNVAATTDERHRSMADEISDAEDTRLEESSTATTDDRYRLYTARSDAESTFYSDNMSEAYSETSQSSRSVRYSSRDKTRKRELHLPAPKEQDQDHSLEALEVQEEDFLKEHEKSSRRRLKGKVRSDPVGNIEVDNDDDDDDDDDDEEDEDVKTFDEDERMHEADDEQDDDDDDEDEDFTDNEGLSYVSPDNRTVESRDNLTVDRDDEDDDDDDDDEEEEDHPSFGRELSEMAQELTRGGPAVLIDWLALRTPS